MATSNHCFIWKLHAIRLKGRWAIHGLLLKGFPPSVTHGNESILGTFNKVFQSYFKKPLANHALTVETAGLRQEALTNEEGEFLCFSEQENIQPFSFFTSETGLKIPIIQNYQYHFDKEGAPLLLISDIDDTILVSKSSKFLSKLRLMLFSPSAKRKMVAENQRAYEELDIESIQFAYVSGSESNLFHLITSFFQVNDLPAGPLYLRPYVHWRQLLNRKGREQYKLNRIERLIDYFPDKQLLLFGDDSQQDLQVFTTIAAQYPQKVKSVFLRRTGLTKRHRHKEKSWQLPNSAVTVYYYDNFEDIASPIQTIIDENTFRS